MDSSVNAATIFKRGQTRTFHINKPLWLQSSVSQAAE